MVKVRKMAKEVEFKNVSARNYLIAIGLVLTIIIVAWFGFRWGALIKEKSVSTSYLLKEKVLTKDSLIYSINCLYNNRNNIIKNLEKNCVSDQSAYIAKLLFDYSKKK